MAEIKVFGKSSYAITIPDYFLPKVTKEGYSIFQVYEVQQQQLVNRFLKWLVLIKSTAVPSKRLTRSGSGWRELT